ncbi:uncharacterized protein CDAR_110691 [Caerostris darwini]|uniref:Odorant receptor n=1 Tax=Caerostris darwini TaxID=1538125 RepID=A0AAV4S7Q9_9ARAC|nr:uncharacterized protein CDAR_110691 [Caerostris darwini]
MCGSAILEEGEKLKKVGLECPQEVCQQSCLISKEKDKYVTAFFLLLGSIRDNLLRVTGGALTFYSTIICGLILEVILNSKRYEISSALNHLSRISGNLNPRCTIAIKFVIRNRLLYVLSVLIYVISLVYFTFVQDWSRYKATVKFPFYIPPGRAHDVCLGFVLTSSMYSGISGGNTCGVICLLCNTIYLTVSSLITSYGSNLNQKFKTQNMSTFIFNEIKNFKSIVLLIEAVDKALNVCVLFLYCEICSMIFITISLAISKERSFQSGAVKLMIAWNFINQFYLFYNVTMGGSAIQKKGEKLKKVGLECPQELCQKSCLISKDKDRIAMSFFLLLGSIRDNPLSVTGGGMFVIQKKIFLTVMNAVVTYSIIMFQLSL